MTQICRLTILICFLFSKTNSYIQFSLYKRTTKFQQQKPLICDMKSIDGDQNQKSQTLFKQFCYQKDRSYYIQLFLLKSVYQMSMDLTSPISWLKGSSCKVIDYDEKKCEILNPTIQYTIKNKIIERKQINRKHITPQNQQSQSQNQQHNLQLKKIKKQNHNHQFNQNQKGVKIYGSSQVISGYLEKNRDIQFWSKDSGRLSRLADVLMLGFYFIQEKEKINLKSSNFVNVTSLTQRTNSLSDGAISLRFDQNSQKPFLTQIFEFAQTQEKTITIYLNERENIITIGQLSIKYSAEGYSGIKWINLATEETQYGNLPIITSIFVQNLKNSEQHHIEKSVQMFGIITLSASYIGIPQSLAVKLIDQLDSLVKCSINQKSYLQCLFSNKKNISQFKQINLVFQFDGISISLQTNQLIAEQKHKKLVLNIKQIVQNDYIILGQPVFTKYFTILDYQKNRIGFSLKKNQNQHQIINVVSLIRFVTFIFVLGCSILLCFRPLQKMITSFKRKQSFNKKSSQGRRLRYSTQQNSYDQVNQKLREVFSQ